MLLSSPAFEQGEPIPVDHTADGDNRSIPVRWTDVPPEAVELALVMEDLDAPGDEPWTHWVLYNLSSAIAGLPSSIRQTITLDDPVHAAQGRNSWRERNIGYRGPAPPEGRGPHRYRIRLFALCDRATIAPGADARSLLDAIKKNIIAEAQLIGTYER